MLNQTILRLLLTAPFLMMIELVSLLKIVLKNLTKFTVMIMGLLQELKREWKKEMMIRR